LIVANLVAPLARLIRIGEEEEEEEGEEKRKRY